MSKKVVPLLYSKKKKKIVPLLVEHFWLILYSIYKHVNIIFYYIIFSQKKKKLNTFIYSPCQKNNNLCSHNLISSSSNHTLTNKNNTHINL